LQGHRRDPDYLEDVTRSLTDAKGQPLAYGRRRDRRTSDRTDVARPIQVGAMLGYEQPISSTVSFVADWFSGKNLFATSRLASPSPCLTAACSTSVKPGERLLRLQRHRALFAYYGITFP